MFDDNINNEIYMRVKAKELYSFNFVDYVIDIRSNTIHKITEKTIYSNDNDYIAFSIKNRKINVEELLNRFQKYLNNFKSLNIDEYMQYVKDFK